LHVKIDKFQFPFDSSVRTVPRLITLFTHSTAKIPQATKDDYDSAKQINHYPSWNVKDNYFCSRGHLSPSADFATNDECEMTYLHTNVAPQWHKFNDGNWAALEDAVRKYAEKKGTDVYVFTGTG
jgi:DNA/RNA endonuclease G (NUC1)